MKKIESGIGIKLDTNKIPMDLLFKRGLMEIAKVLDFGAKKYNPWNWLNVVDTRGGRARVLAALERHLALYSEVSEKDSETLVTHMAHLGCNVFFLLYRDLPLEERKAIRARLAEVYEDPDINILPKDMENAQKNTDRTDGLKDNKPSASGSDKKDK